MYDVAMIVAIIIPGWVREQASSSWRPHHRTRRFVLCRREGRFTELRIASIYPHCCHLETMCMQYVTLRTCVSIASCRLWRALEVYFREISKTPLSRHSKATPMDSLQRNSRRLYGGFEVKRFQRGKESKKV